MKLTNRTIPQAKNYQCDKCKAIKCHANMHDDNVCYECWYKENTEGENTEGISFIELGGYQLKPRGHLRGVNYFKETWGGEIVYYNLEYPFFHAIGRKLVRNIILSWWINEIYKMIASVVQWKHTSFT